MDQGARGAILFNPVGMVHARSIDLFRRLLRGREIRCIYNPVHYWFSGPKRPDGPGFFYFHGGRLPRGLFDGVKALVLFSAQPRAPHCSLLQEAAIRGVPVIAIEEVYQMLLEQGYVNEYTLPVDRLFAASEYEREAFITAGADPATVETAGCLLRHRERKATSDPDRELLRKKLNLSGDKKVAMLSLAYYTPSGETPDVRRRLLERVNNGLPADYDLIIKPHPAESGEGVTDTIRRHAPRARIADRYAPIDDVLDITDVLFNRGNSQVIVDALQRSIPVVVVPTGRRTFFQDMGMNDVIVEEECDVPRALKAIREKGMSIYGEIFGKYLGVDPKTAFIGAAERIDSIADTGRVLDPAGRLEEISLFWAWMGYGKQAMRCLKAASEKSGTKRLAGNMANIISCRGTREDLSLLKAWCGPRPYREALLQSLWIKNVFYGGAAMEDDHLEWVRAFPPRMNRETYLSYCYMLYLIYARSGLSEKAEALRREISDEYGFMQEVKNFFDASWRFRTGYSAKLVLKNIKMELSGFCA